MKNLSDAIKWLLNNAIPQIWNEIIEPFLKSIPSALEALWIIIKTIFNK